MKTITYRNENGSLIKGAIFKIILNNGGYYLTDLIVYADGEIYCLGRISMEKLKDYLNSGKLVRTLPKESTLFIPFLGYVQVSNDVSSSYGNDKFIEILNETIKSLNEENQKEKCIQLFKEYLLNPNHQNLKKLKKSYSLIPQNERALFEIDYKDALVKFLSTEKELSREEREYILNDYFDGEWIELK